MDLSFSSDVSIAPGVNMPRLGFGTYKSVGAEALQAVRAALKVGYRSIDTASLYGNEVEIGQAVRESGVPRDALFITTKVWNDEQGYDATRQALERSLQRLGTDYLDLYLVHWPNRELMESTWRSMEELRAEGRVRSIGVCNHLAHHLEKLLSLAEVPPAVDQIEFHPRLQQPELQTYLKDNGITLEAWAPLMKGRVGDESKLVSIARKHSVTPAQVAIRWVLENGHVAIPKSVHEQRIADNAAVFGFSLTDEDHKEIESLDSAERLGPDPDTYNW